MVNAAKLSMSAATAVATPVSVSDGFYVSGFGDARDGFWFAYPGDKYLRTLPFVGDDNDLQCQYGFGEDANLWAFGTQNSGYSITADTHGSNPWDSTWTGQGLTLTHPASQQLAAANTAVMGMFVPEGGDFSKRGTFNGKDYYNLLGQEDNDHVWAISYDGSAWHYYDDHGIVDSGGDGVSPDQAGLWTAITTPSPLTVDDLISGFKIGTDTYAVNGSQNGRPNYVDVLDASHIIKWVSVGDGWTNEVDVLINSGNVAFPWEGTPEVTVTKSRPAGERNWAPRSPSTNANLLTLSPSDGELIPPFDPDITEYTISTETMAIAVTENEFASVDSPVSLMPGHNLIVVTAEDGTTKTYTVTVSVAMGEEGCLTESRGFGEENGFTEANGFTAANGFTIANGF